MAKKKVVKVVEEKKNLGPKGKNCYFDFNVIFSLLY